MLLDATWVSILLSKEKKMLICLGSINWNFKFCPLSFTSLIFDTVYVCHMFFCPYVLWYMLNVLNESLTIVSLSQFVYCFLFLSPFLITSLWLSLYVCLSVQMFVTLEPLTSTTSKQKSWATLDEDFVTALKWTKYIQLVFILLFSINVS